MYLSCFFNGLLYYSRERLEKWKGAEEKKYKKGTGERNRKSMCDGESRRKAF